MDPEGPAAAPKFSDDEEEEDLVIRVSTANVQVLDERSDNTEEMQAEAEAAEKEDATEAQNTGPPGFEIGTRVQVNKRIFLRGPLRSSQGTGTISGWCEFRSVWYVTMDPGSITAAPDTSDDEEEDTLIILVGTENIQVLEELPDSVEAPEL